MSRPGVWSLVSLAAGIGFWGCGSGGVGEDECRSIEYARCSAGQFCGLRIDSPAKLTECEQFSRDNCLHGLASGQTPRATDLEHCVAAIKSAGTCAHRQGSNTLATDCGALLGSFDSARTTVCDVIQNPEDTSECGFLTDKPVEVVPKDAGTD